MKKPPYHVPKAYHVPNDGLEVVVVGSHTVLFQVQTLCAVFNIGVDVALQFLRALRVPVLTVGAGGLLSRGYFNINALDAALYALTRFGSRRMVVDETLELTEADISEWCKPELASEMAAVASDRLRAGSHVAEQLLQYYGSRGEFERVGPKVQVKRPEPGRRSDGRLKEWSDYLKERSSASS